MWDLTVEIQEFQFDKHYDITSLLWRNLPTMHNWYQSRFGPEALARHREQSVGVAGWSSDFTWSLSCPRLQLTWSHPPPGGGNYLVDKTSSELRPGRPQTVRPVITEKHSSPPASAHVYYHSPVQLFLVFQLFKNNFHQIKKIFYSDRAEPTSCQCTETLHFPGP